MFSIVYVNSRVLLESKEALLASGHSGCKGSCIAVIPYSMKVRTFYFGTGKM